MNDCRLPRYGKVEIMDITDVTEMGLHDRVTPSPHTLGRGHVTSFKLLSLRQDPIFLRAAPHSPAEVTPFENTDAKLTVHLHFFRKCKSSALKNSLSSYEFILHDPCMALGLFFLSVSSVARMAALSIGL